MMSKLHNMNSFGVGQILSLEASRAFQKFQIINDFEVLLYGFYLQEVFQEYVRFYVSV